MEMMMVSLSEMFADANGAVYIVPVVMLAGFAIVGYYGFKEIKSRLKK